MNKSIHNYSNIDNEYKIITSSPERVPLEYPLHPDYSDMVALPIRGRNELIRKCSSFDLEANEAEADLSMNAQINTTTLSG